MMYGMEKTTVYLPGNLKRALGRAARESGRSEAEVIREGIGLVTGAHQVAGARIPLFEPGQPDLAERADEYLGGRGPERLERTQISLTRTQAERLRRIARHRGTSMAALIRAAVEQVHPVDDEQALEARWARALAAVGGARSGVPDLGTDHDRYLVDTDE